MEVFSIFYHTRSKYFSGWTCVSADSTFNKLRPSTGPNFVHHWYHCEIVNGTPQCVPDKAESLPGQKPAPVTCASTLCAEGTHCEEIDGQPQCVKNPAESLPGQKPAPVTCASTLCAEGTHCEEIDGQPQCVKNPGPCAAAFCAGGECIEYNDTFGCFNTTCGAREEFVRCPSCESTCGFAVVCGASFERR
ncbi:hypothetical protein COOONC_12060 [Cooperia oncophora]